MTTYRQGDTILGFVPLPGNSIEKKRPGVVLSSNEFNRENQITIIAPITSSISGDGYEIEIKGNDFQSAGLVSESVVKYSIILSLDNSKITRKLGSFPEGLFKKVIEKTLENFKRG